MIGVVIPTRDRDDMMLPLVKHLLADECEPVVAVMDNGMAPNARRRLPEKALCWSMRGHSIYSMWNAGWAGLLDLPSRARALLDHASSLAQRVSDVTEVCFLNDDAWLKHGALPAMAELLRAEPNVGIVYPDYNRGFEWNAVDNRDYTETQGSYRHGGMCGWCFMVPAELPLRFDEQFEWWYGDDDFARQVQHAGLRQLRLLSKGVTHEGEATAHLHEWTHAAKERDHERFRAKWVML